MILLGKAATVNYVISCGGCRAWPSGWYWRAGYPTERRGLDGHCYRACPKATRWIRLGVAFTRQLAGCGHDHRACGCV